MFIALQGNCNVLNNERVVNIVSELLLEFWVCDCRLICGAMDLSMYVNLDADNIITGFENIKME